MRLKLLSSLCIIIFFSCNRKSEPPRIVFAEQLLKDVESINEYYDSGFQRTRYEYYIVANPPKNRDSLLKIVKKHNDSLKLLNDSIEKKYDLFNRTYYKESKKTPVDFVEDCGGGFITDCIYDHTEDFLCGYVMESSNNNSGQRSKSWKFYCSK